jgi:predicted N-formylglutamate amidohydrolase
VDGDGGKPEAFPNPVVAENATGTGAFVIVCDHASNRIPKQYGSFGFEAAALQTHIAWDPGALAVARLLSKQFDAPLLWPDVSRLIIDCNRDPDSDTLIVVESEGRTVEANRGLSNAERARRLASIHAPYHAAIDACLARRSAADVPTSLIAIHSYTPVYLGRARPWQIGIVFGEDRLLADILISDLQLDRSLTIGINEPYSPADSVYYTVERHAGVRHLPAAMIEIRNDEIGDAVGQGLWADRLTTILVAATPRLVEASDVAA